MSGEVWAHAKFTGEISVPVSVTVPVIVTVAVAVAVTDDQETISFESRFFYPLKVASVTATATVTITGTVTDTGTEILSKTWPGPDSMPRLIQNRDKSIITSRNIKSLKSRNSPVCHLIQTATKKNNSVKLP